MRRVLIAVASVIALAYAVSGFSRTFAQTPKAEMTRVPQFENERAV
jgi:hypothetical protein